MAKFFLSAFPTNRNFYCHSALRVTFPTGSMQCVCVEYMPAPICNTGILFLKKKQDSC